MKTGDSILRTPGLAVGIIEVTGAEPSEEIYGALLDSEQRFAEGMGESPLAALIAINLMSAKPIAGVEIDPEERYDRKLTHQEHIAFASQRMAVAKAVTGLLRIVPRRIEIAHSEESRPVGRAIEHLAVSVVEFATSHEPFRLIKHISAYESGLKPFATKRQKKDIKAFAVR